MDKCPLQFTITTIAATFSTMPKLWALWWPTTDHNILVNDFLQHPGSLVYALPTV